MLALAGLQPIEAPATALQLQHGELGHELAVANTEGCCLGGCDIVLVRLGHCTVWRLGPAARLRQSKPVPGKLYSMLHAETGCLICTDLAVHPKPGHLPEHQHLGLCMWQVWGNIGELGPVPCDKLFAYWWWKIWYEWGVLIACCLALAIGKDVPLSMHPCNLKSSTLHL